MKKINYRKLQIISTLAAILIFTAAVNAQATAFNYQGKLNNGGTAANGNYEMQFKLFDALAGGAQVGTTFTDLNVAVINGIFTTTLDFTAASFNIGQPRYLEISVRPAGDANPFTTLSPRTAVNSSPYAIQAKTAANALQLGGVDASEYVTTTTVGSSFIKNDTVPQTGNFNITGNGIVGSSIGIGIAPLAGYKLDVNANSLFRTTGTGGNMQIATPGGETGITISGANRADIRFDGTTLRLFAGTGGGIPGNGLIVNTLGNVATSGNLGVGTFSPDTRLTLNGGPVWTSGGWTASMNLRNGAAFGWDANPSGRRGFYYPLRFLGGGFIRDRAARRSTLTATRKPTSAFFVRLTAAGSICARLTMLPAFSVSAPRRTSSRRVITTATVKPTSPSFGLLPVFGLSSARRIIHFSRSRLELRVILRHRPIMIMTAKPTPPSSVRQLPIGLCSARPPEF